MSDTPNDEYRKSNKHYVDFWAILSWFPLGFDRANRNCVTFCLWTQFTDKKSKVNSFKRKITSASFNNISSSFKFETFFQVINKFSDQSFTKSDEEVFSRYLQFCGIGLRNAHLYEKSQLEIKRNQVLLDLARMIFEEQSTIEHVVFRILTHTQSLIQCQRVQVS